MQVPLELRRAQLWVADVMDFPIEIELLRNPYALGCKTPSGGGMNLFQAAKAFELCSGVKAR